MDLLKAISELRAEREQILNAILALERLARGQGKRRGRPPKWMSDAAPITPRDAQRSPKRVFSPETLRKMAAAQKRRWAAQRKTTAGEG